MLRFLRSPVEILGEGEDGPVTGMRVGRNRIEPAPDGRLRAVPTGREEVIACGLVLRSIGYRGRPLADIPFDERRGLIRNNGGRVCDEDGEPLRGEYAVGWIKRGPSGVIGTNKKDAADTVARIVEDAEARRARRRRPSPTPRRRARGCPARAGRRRVGRLGGDRRTRVPARRAGRPAARQARHRGRARRGESRGAGAARR